MYSSKSHFEIWPKPKLTSSDMLAINVPKIETIENFFQDLYANTHAVLMPSGRSSINLILQYLNISRQDLIYTPPYSSHCVLNAIGYTGTPTTKLSRDIQAAICFHQWGYTHKINTSAVIIEDSVDSLITSSNGLFPNDGKFEIISLSKVFSSISGGLILCQKITDAQKLRKLRNLRKNFKLTHFMMRIMGLINSNAYSYWNVTEPLNGYIPRILRVNIWNQLMNMDTLISDRRSKIKLLENSSFKLLIPISKYRLPACWMVQENKIPKNTPFSLDMIRHISISNDTKKMIRVLPIPLHQGIKIDQIKTWLPEI